MVRVNFPESNPSQYWNRDSNLPKLAAGLPMEEVISSNTSVFVSGFNRHHADRINSDLELSFKHKPTGAENSMISGRVSWFYDLQGASLTVDTACSSSLVALHLARQDLAARESKMVSHP